MKDKIENGINNYLSRIKRIRQIYIEVLDKVPNDNSPVWNIKDRNMFNKIILNFITGLDQNKATGDLMNLYDIAIHKKTKSLIIANKGATLFSLSGKVFLKCGWNTYCLLTFIYENFSTTKFLLQQNKSNLLLQFVANVLIFDILFVLKRSKTI